VTRGHPDPVVTVQSRPGCPATIGSRMACSSALGEAFWTDAVLLAHAGIPTMLFGVDGAGAHAASEWVDLQSLHDGLLPQVVPTGAPVEATLLGLGGRARRADAGPAQRLFRALAPRP
jgi:hypothetical protein